MYVAVLGDIMGWGVLDIFLSMMLVHFRNEDLSTSLHIFFLVVVIALNWYLHKLLNLEECVMDPNLESKIYDIYISARTIFRSKAMV